MSWKSLLREGHGYVKLSSSSLQMYLGSTSVYLNFKLIYIFICTHIYIYIYIAFPLHIQCFYVLLSIVCIKKVHMVLLLKFNLKINVSLFLVPVQILTAASVLQFFVPQIIQIQNREEILLNLSLGALQRLAVFRRQARDASIIINIGINPLTSQMQSILGYFQFSESGKKRAHFLNNLCLDFLWLNVTTFITSQCQKPAVESCDSQRKVPLTSCNGWLAPLWSLGGKRDGALNILIVNIFAI